MTNVEVERRLNDFKPRDYQLPILAALNDGFKRVLAILPRRAGKDITALNHVIREMWNRPGVYYYIFPTYSQAKKVIWDSITNDGKRILDYFPKELVTQQNSQEMKIRMMSKDGNESLFQLVGSDNIDSLMGTNPRGVVFSEYALQDPRAYQYISPILTANGGWALFISCVVPNTLVMGSNGFQRIKDISCSRDEYSDLNKPIYGLGGFHNAEQFYYGGKQSTLKVTLETGFSVECTPIHPIWNGSSWVKSNDLEIGDLLPVQYGQNVFGSGVSLEGMNRNSHGSVKKTIPDPLTDDLFYLAGLVQGDGCYGKSSITIANSDPEIIDFLLDWGFNSTSRPFHHTLSSVDMCDFLEFLGVGKGAKNKAFPERLFQGTRGQVRAFIQGWFDTDGSSHANRGTVKLCSICEEGMKDLQVILLNFGVVTSLYSSAPGVSKKVKGVHPCFTLEASGYFASEFYKYLGFRLPRKQRNKASLKPNTLLESGNIYPVDISRLNGYSLPKKLITNPQRISRRLITKLNSNNPHPYWDELLKEKFYYSRVKSIEKGESEVFDFVIPETHSFMSNGLISHNTPRGKNHLWSLAQVAQVSPEWFYLKLSVEDTNHIPLSEIEKEKREGIMSEDMIQQEYYTSFTMGVEGAYYAKYVDQCKRDGRISSVAWESAFKVHTAWDIGVRDSTCIIFFQTIGQTIRLIDCYENSKEGLEHYAQVIASKPYQYGIHVAPHDIRVTEWGSGMTRIEKAKQLGIKFSIADDLSIPDGIESVRSLFSKLWIDEKKCAPLIKALENYRQEYDIKRKVYKPRPLHDWSSHFCDSMRYLAISLPKTRDGLSAEELEARYQKVMHGNQGNLPHFFRDGGIR